MDLQSVIDSQPTHDLLYSSPLSTTLLLPTTDTQPHASLYHRRRRVEEGEEREEKQNQQTRHFSALDLRQTVAEMRIFPTQQKMFDFVDSKNGSFSLETTLPMTNSPFPKKIRVDRQQQQQALNDDSSDDRTRLIPFSVEFGERLLPSTFAAFSSNSGGLATSPLRQNVLTNALPENGESPSTQLPPHQHLHQQTRFFAAATLEVATRFYSKVPHLEQHLYEILREGAPCRLYMDVEKTFSDEAVAQWRKETSSSGSAVGQKRPRPKEEEQEDASQTTTDQQALLKARACRAECNHLHDPKLTTEVLVESLRTFLEESSLDLTFEDQDMVVLSSTPLAATSSAPPPKMTKFSQHYILRTLRRRRRTANNKKPPSSSPKVHCIEEQENDQSMEPDLLHSSSSLSYHHFHFSDTREVGMLLRAFVEWLYRRAAVDARVHCALFYHGYCSGPMEEGNKALSGSTEASSFYYLNVIDDANSVEEQSLGESVDASEQQQQHLPTVAVETHRSLRARPLRCIIDEGVYSRNRMMRCFGSCKLGKPMVLDLDPSWEPNRLVLSSSAEVFQASLITWFTRAQREASAAIPSEELVKLFEQHLQMTSATRHLFAHLGPDGGHRCGGATPRIAHATVDGGLLSLGGGGSVELPVTAAFVLHLATVHGVAPNVSLDPRNANLSSVFCNWTSPQAGEARTYTASIRTMVTLGAKNRPTAPDDGIIEQSSTLVISTEGRKFCQRIGREHKSNSPYYVLNLEQGTVVQKCYDSDCSGFRSGAALLPMSVLQELSLRFHKAAEALAKRNTTRDVFGANDVMSNVPLNPQCLTFATPTTQQEAFKGKCTRFVPKSQRELHASSPNNR